MYAVSLRNDDGSSDSCCSAHPGSQPHSSQCLSFGASASNGSSLLLRPHMLDLCRAICTVQRHRVTLALHENRQSRMAAS